jgi:hypothetical protein
MRLPTKSGFAMATILAASFGFAGSIQAAPLAGVADTVLAVQKAQTPGETDGLIQKAYHKGYAHKGKSYHHYNHHHHYHHHHHHHHHYYKPHPEVHPEPK